MAGDEIVRVFVSHHHSPDEDEFTARLVADLEAAGADVWVDRQRISSGDFVKKINEGLAGRQWLVLVMTPDALRSEWVQDEVNAAYHQIRQKRMLGIIPIVAKPCDDEDIPPLWGPLHSYDATSDYETARDGLLRAMGLTPVAVVDPAALVEAPASDILATAPVAPPAPAPTETRVALLSATAASLPPPKSALVQAPPIEEPLLEATPAGAPVEPPTPPSPEPDHHGWTPAFTWARFGVSVAVVALVVVVVAAAATHGFGLLGGGSSSQIPAATQTARAALAHGPTASYGPTAPGRCDSGPLASQWTAIPEDSAVTCPIGAAQVSGPAILTFSGSGGFAMGSSFSITLSDLRSDSKDHCLDFVISAPRLVGQDRGAVHEKLCLNGALSGGSVGGIFNDEITSTIASTNGSVILGIIVTSDTWTLLIGGKTLASKAFSPSNTRPSSLDAVQIQVDAGASVTLSDFTVRPS